MVSLTPYNLPAPPTSADGVQESGGRLEFAVHKVRNHGILSPQKAEVTRQRDSSGITQWAPTTASMPQGKCPHTRRSPATPSSLYTPYFKAFLILLNLKVQKRQNSVNEQPNPKSALGSH